MFHVPDEGRIRSGGLASRDADGNNGAFVLRAPCGVWLWIIASDGLGWEHVSVHSSYDRRGRKARTPTWEEMCLVKGCFWDLEDVVVQYHPRASAYVNTHPHTLHLWRPIGQELASPPALLVGPSEVRSEAGGEGV